MNIALVVEDNEGVLDVLVQTLSFVPGLKVVTETDGLNALHLVVNSPEEEKINLVIMDKGLPKMNGVDSYIKMREVKPKLPIVILNGGATDEFLLARVVHDKYLYVFQKPFNFQILNELVKHILNTQKY